MAALERHARIRSESELETISSALSPTDSPLLLQLPDVGIGSGGSGAPSASLQRAATRLVVRTDFKNDTDILGVPS